MYNTLSDRVLRRLGHLEMLINFDNFVKTFRNNRTNMDDAKTKLLTAKEVAKIFGVHPYTVYNWIKKGSIKAIRLEGSNRFFIDVSEVKNLKDRK